MLSLMRDAWAIGVLGLLAVTACGARTALKLPDAAAVLDTPDDHADDTTDAADAPPDLALDVCAVRSIPVQRQTPTVLLLLDRSGSMSQDLQGNSGLPSRWDVLQTALERSLGRFERAIEMGVMLFPASSSTSGLCSASVSLDLRPQLNNANAILQVMRRSVPTGRTPTWAALQSATRWFDQNATSGRSFQVVLATDGAPNCNATLNGLACTCTGLGTTTTNECEREPELCLDDTRTIDGVRALAGRGITTYVIGIDGDRRGYLVDVLNALARAGGRPNPRTPERAYYSVQQPQDLDSAFDAIQRTVVECNLAATRRPPAGASVRLEIDGETIAHDPTRAQGWDWNSPTSANLTLYGAACERAQQGSRAISLRVLCE
jgi:predicted small lipoprotein YifL